MPAWHVIDRILLALAAYFQRGNPPTPFDKGGLSWVSYFAPLPRLKIMPLSDGERLICPMRRITLSGIFGAGSG